MGFYSKLHAITNISIFIIEILLGVVLAKVFKYKEEKYKSFLLKFIAIIILIMELLKQIISFKNGYDLYHVPLHYCSLFIFLLPLSAFYSGKYKYKIRNITISCIGALWIVMLIYPRAIYSEYSIRNCFKEFMSFHTVVFHLLVCFYLVLTIALTKCTFSVKKDIINNCIFLLLYLSIGAIFSQVLKTNYNNLYYCQAEFMENFRLSLVKYLGFGGQLIYICCNISTTIAVTNIGYYLINCIYKKIKN